MVLQLVCIERMPQAHAVAYSRRGLPKCSKGVDPEPMLFEVLLRRRQLHWRRWLPARRVRVWYGPDERWRRPATVWQQDVGRVGTPVV